MSARGDAEAGGARSGAASPDAEAAAPAGERVSRWFAVDQARIDAFAEVTEDHQPIHVDPAAGAASAFGTTVAHGFLTLSMLSAMAYDAMPDLAPGPGVTGVNYGFDRVRFVAPVPAGARVRGRFALEGEERGPGWVSRRWDVTVEIEGAERPAIVALWINRRYGGAA